MIERLVKWLNREKPPRSFPLSNFEKISHELRPCDVVLIEGRSRVSEIIRWLTNSPWTHAALYIGRIYDIEDEDLRAIVRRHYRAHQGNLSQEDKPREDKPQEEEPQEASLQEEGSQEASPRGDDSDRLIIESLLGHGTIVRPLNVYERDHLRICRPARLSHSAAEQVVRYAVSRLGVDYDIRQIIDLARFLFPWYIMPKRWVSSLFAPEGSRRMKTVCSTMIAEAFGYVQFPILPLVKQTDGQDVQLFRRNPRLCTPSDFDYSPYFEIIKYSFVDIYHEEYHLLPWKGTGMLTGAEANLYFNASEPNVEEVENAIAEAAASSQARGDDEGEAEESPRCEDPATRQQNPPPSP